MPSVLCGVIGVVAEFMISQCSKASYLPSMLCGVIGVVAECMASP
jgi:hypothetical protein